MQLVTMSTDVVISTGTSGDVHLIQHYFCNKVCQWLQTTTNYTLTIKAQKRTEESYINYDKQILIELITARYIHPWLFVGGLVSCVFVCFIVYNDVSRDLTIRSLPVYYEVRVAHHFSFLCCIIFFLLHFSSICVLCTQFCQWLDFLCVIFHLLFSNVYLETNEKVKKKNNSTIYYRYNVCHRCSPLAAIYKTDRGDIT